MNNTWCVYCHTNKINGKKYIGITSRAPESRWGVNGSGYGHTLCFAKAIHKYGWDNFEHEILHNNLTEKEAKDLEVFYIDKYRTCLSFDDCNGYNATLGGEGTKGIIVSEDTRRKSSLSHMGHKISEEHKNKLLSYHLNVPMKQSTKDKIGESHYKEVDMFDIKDGHFIKRFKSISEAKEYIGASGIHIGEVCDGKRKSAGGYIWRYANAAKNVAPQTITHRSKVLQINPQNMEIIHIWPSCNFAQNELGIKTSIASACRGERKHVAGYIWKYYDDLSQEEL